jgi:hypothetical protein
LIVQRRSAFGNTQQWSRPFFATGITTDENGHTIAVGSNLDMVTTAGDKDMVVVQYDRNGNEMWRTTKAYSTWQFLGAKVAVDGAGNALVSSALLPDPSPFSNPEFTRLEFFSGRDGHDAWHGGGDLPDVYDRITREMRGSASHGIFIVTQQYERGTTTPAGVLVTRQINRTYYTDVTASGGRLADDILWRNDDGRVALWLMENGTSLSAAGLIGPGTGWVPTQRGNFDPSTTEDIVWQHPDGRSAIWLMNGTTQVGGGALLPAGTGWHVRIARDFNQDFREDLVWEHDDGRVAIWLMDGARQIGGAGLLPAGTGWRVKLVTDLNYDNTPDIVWEHPTKGTAVWLMHGTQQVGGALLSTTMKALASDHITSDLNEDLVMADDAGRLQLWEMDGATPRNIVDLRAAGSPVVSKVVLQDIDGDTTMDMLLMRADGGLDAIFMSDRGQVAGTATLLPAGSPWSLKRIGFFDSDAQWELLLESTDGTVAFGKWDGAALHITPIFGGGTGWHPVSFLDRERS